MSASERLSKHRIRRNFDRAAPQYERSAVLSREVLSRLMERFELMRLSPRRILDIGSGTGMAARALAQRYHGAQLICLDLSWPMLNQVGARGLLRTWRSLVGVGSHRVCADLERLPIRDGAIDVVVSNLALHWVQAPLAFAQASRVLQAGGLFMFSTLGPGTLKELAHAAADSTCHSPVHAFVDMHDLGDQLLAAGFADPVMEMECLTFTYETLDQLFDDLKATGALSARSFHGLRTPRCRDRMEQRYESARRAGRLPATFEVVFGHAWKAQRQSTRTAQGHPIIQFEPRRRTM